MNDIIEAPQQEMAVQSQAAPATPAMLLQMAVQSGADLEKMEKLMDMQDRWEKAQAKKAYDAAFAAFKSEAIKIIRNKSVGAGPLSGKKYAELHNIVNTVTPALSRHGLSSSWQLTIDDKDWIQVTCTLRHTAGHMESVAMGGPPDAGGAKNAIQARASTVSYLERYTLKAILGISEQDDDTDANVPAQKEGNEELFSLTEKLQAATSPEELAKIMNEAPKALRPKLVPIFNECKKTVNNG